MEVTFCKEKWKNLRTVFVRNNKPTPSGSARKSKKPYYLNEHLQFLLPYVKPSTDLTTSRNLSSPTPDHESENNKQSDTEDQDEDLTQQEQNLSDKITNENHEKGHSPEKQIKGTNKKRKSEVSQVDQSFIDFMKLKKTKMCGEDPRKMFLLSLLPDINIMTDKQMRMFKKKVLEVVDDILTENPTPTSNTPITSHPNTAFSYLSGSSLLGQ
ncbi:uncharacterized protein LOC112686182 isoform X2 [Sipha flava]|uniref:Uncharacterized protein LOC112686182 isoform X2 n=1 Tax=Sipha flava TaxID=143950 RepID=A0A8B8FUK4_9HEMI|nr:uncharacterized protein LOC112686182 isoform X2 [Sipha flava]